MKHGILQERDVPAVLNGKDAEGQDIVMVIGSGLIELWIAESRSLKEKRGILKRILQRTQNAFNVSIAEIGENDSWKRARVGFCVVGNDARYVNGKVDHILSFIDELQLAEVMNSKIEIVTVSDAMPHFEDHYGKFDYDEE